MIVGHIIKLFYSAIAREECIKLRIHHNQYHGTLASLPHHVEVFHVDAWRQVTCTLRVGRTCSARDENKQHPCEPGICTYYEDLFAYSLAPCVS